MKRENSLAPESLEAQIRDLVSRLKDTPSSGPGHLLPLKKKPFQNRSLASRIDHTLLKPEATLDQILAICAEARQYGFASVCVHSHWLPEVVKALRGSGALPITVVGFPHGAQQPSAKAAEARLAVKAGAREIDMVVNLGRLKSHDWKSVAQDIQGVVRAAGKTPVKVIIETALLTTEEKVIVAILCELSGAAYVKTSTGFSGGGATVEDVALFRRLLGSRVKIKASGGIRTREFAEALLAAGANRLGTSNSVAIVNEETATNQLGSY